MQRAFECPRMDCSSAPASRLCSTPPTGSALLCSAPPIGFATVDCWPPRHLAAAHGSSAAAPITISLISRHRIGHLLHALGGDPISPFPSEPHRRPCRPSHLLAACCRRVPPLYRRRLHAASPRPSTVRARLWSRDFPLSHPPSAPPPNSYRSLLLCLSRTLLPTSSTPHSFFQHLLSFLHATTPRRSSPPSGPGLGRLRVICDMCRLLELGRNESIDHRPHSAIRPLRRLGPSRILRLRLFNGLRLRAVMRQVAWLAAVVANPLLWDKLRVRVTWRPRRARCAWRPALAFFASLSRAGRQAPAQCLNLRRHGFDFGIFLIRLRVPLARGRSFGHALPDRQLQEQVGIERQRETDRARGGGRSSQQGSFNATCGPKSQSHGSRTSGGASTAVEAWSC